MPTLAAKIGIAAAGAAVAFKILDAKHHISNDIKWIRRLLPFKRQVGAWVKQGFNTAQLWYQTLAKYPNRSCVEMDDQKYTFKQMEAASNRVANWGLAQGLKKGDRIALVMENKPEYIMCWLGMTKLGVEVALINNNLRSRSLVHCIKVSHAKFCIFGVEVADAISEVRDQLLDLGVKQMAWGGEVSFCPSLDGALMDSSTEPVSSKLWKAANMTDNFGFIYTSGTTGLPKAAVIKHAKMCGFGAAFCNAYQITSKDRVYCCLPLYHSAGGGCGTGMMLYGGATLVIRRKFSASKFWKEVGDFRCSVVQYIGELCRYLLTAPPSPYDKKHRVRICIGNGLRPDIWAQFQERFNVPEIGEFYGATEGNIALFNHCTTVEDRGTVGRFGTIMMKATGMKLVKFDVAEEVPIRNSAGFCVECADGEPGELLGLIKPGDVGTAFQGYTDEKATNKKVLRDAFVKGDQYFRTGDLLMRDAKGYFYFVDRIGDTFRWKGENVSTTEVAETLSIFPGVQEVNVYGAAVPGKDGRACMAAMVFDESKLDFDGLLAHASKELPSYAVPLFIRRLPEIEITGTFKHRKVALRKEGFNPAEVTDPLFWLNPATKKYEVLDATAYQQIVGGRARL